MVWYIHWSQASPQCGEVDHTQLQMFTCCMPMPMLSFTHITLCLKIKAKPFKPSWALIGSTKTTGLFGLQLLETKLLQCLCRFSFNFFCIQRCQFFTRYSKAHVQHGFFEKSRTKGPAGNSFKTKWGKKCFEKWQELCFWDQDWLMNEKYAVFFPNYIAATTSQSLNQKGIQ